MGGMTDPAYGAKAVTPSDSTNLSGVRALYIGVSGDVAIMAPGSGTAVTFKSVAVGILPVQCRRVMATGTTATDIVALS